MANTINSVVADSLVNVDDVIINFTNTVKPYHVKINNIVANYSFKDTVQTNIADTSNMQILAQSLIEYALVDNQLVNADQVSVLRPGTTTAINIPAVQFPYIEDYLVTYTSADLNNKNSNNPIYYAATNYDTARGLSRIYIKIPASYIANAEIITKVNGNITGWHDLNYDSDFYILGPNRQIMTIMSPIAEYINTTLIQTNATVTIRLHLTINDAIAIDIDNGTTNIRLPIALDNQNTNYTDSIITGSINAGVVYDTVMLTYNDVLYGTNSDAYNLYSYDLFPFDTQAYAPALSVYGQTNYNNWNEYLVNSAYFYYSVSIFGQKSNSTKQCTFTPAAIINLNTVNNINIEAYQYTTFINNIADNAIFGIGINFLNGTLDQSSVITITFNIKTSSYTVNVNSTDIAINNPNGLNMLTNANCWLNNSASMQYQVADIMNINMYFFNSSANGPIPATSTAGFNNDVLTISVIPNYIVPDSFSYSMAVVNTLTYDSDSYGRNMSLVRDMQLEINYDDINASVVIPIFDINIANSNIQSIDCLAVFKLLYISGRFLVSTANNNYAEFSINSSYASQVIDAPFNILVTNVGQLSDGDSLLFNNYVDYSISSIDDYNVEPEFYFFENNIFDSASRSIVLDQLTLIITNIAGAAISYSISYSINLKQTTISNTTYLDDPFTCDNYFYVKLVSNNNISPLVVGAVFNINTFISNNTTYTANSYHMEFSRTEQNSIQFNYFNQDVFYDDSVFPINRYDNITIDFISYDNTLGYDIIVLAPNNNLYCKLEDVLYNVPIQVSDRATGSLAFVFTIINTAANIIPLPTSGTSSNILSTCTISIDAINTAISSAPLINLNHIFSTQSATLGNLTNGLAGQIIRNIDTESNGDYYTLYMNAGSNMSSNKIISVTSLIRDAIFEQPSISINERLTITSSDGVVNESVQVIYDSFLYDFEIAAYLN